MAFGKVAYQSSTLSDQFAQNAVDGIIDSFQETQMDIFQYWIVDLGNAYEVLRVYVINRVFSIQAIKYSSSKSWLTWCVQSYILNINDFCWYILLSKDMVNLLKWETIWYATNPYQMVAYSISLCNTIELFEISILAFFDALQILMFCFYYRLCMSIWYCSISYNLKAETT